MMKRILIWLLILPILPLAGCTVHKELSFSYIPTGTAPIKSNDQNAQDQLAEAATSVGHSLQQMSAIQMAIHPKAKLPPPLNPAVIGMAQQTSLEWTGPIEPLLRRIASESHYKLRVLGKEPAIPVIVAINSTNVPLADILRDATYQVEKKANITLYPSTRTIELRYYSS